MVLNKVPWVLQSLALPVTRNPIGHPANCEHLAQLLVLAKPKKLSKLAWPSLVTRGSLFFYSELLRHSSKENPFFFTSFLMKIQSREWPARKW